MSSLKDVKHSQGTSRWPKIQFIWYTSQQIFKSIIHLFHSVDKSNHHAGTVKSSSLLRKGTAQPLKTTAQCPLLLWMRFFRASKSNRWCHHSNFRIYYFGLETEKANREQTLETADVRLLKQTCPFGCIVGNVVHWCWSLTSQRKCTGLCIQVHIVAKLCKHITWCPGAQKDLYHFFFQCFSSHKIHKTPLPRGDQYGVCGTHAKTDIRAQENLDILYIEIWLSNTNKDTY